MAAAEFGIDLSSHRSSVANRNAIQQADVILIFDLDDLFRLFFRYPTALRKAFFVGAFQSARDILIRNPTKYPEAVFVSALKAIADSMEQIAGLLAEIR